MKISKIQLRIIKDSRGKGTLEALMSSDKIDVIASVPSGKSKGKREMVSLDPQEAINKFKKIKNKLLNKDFKSLLEFDNFLKNLDDTKDKSNLGGNLTLVLSIAFTKLFAKVNKMEVYELIEKIHGKKTGKFPFLYLNLIGGGLHAKNSLPFQEYILVAKKESPAENLKFAEEIVEKIRKDIIKNFKEERYGDEGAFAITSNDHVVGLEILKRNIDNENAFLALDVAASSFFKNKKYKIGRKFFDTKQLFNIYVDLVKKFPIVSIEDPFSEDDHEGFSIVSKNLENVLIVADDLTVSNKEHIQKAYDKSHANAVIIKPNQIGTVSETLDSIKLSQKFGWKVIVSHRSGETDDDFIADLSFGVGAYGLKSGAPTQKERLKKYERLIEIEKSLKGR